MEFHAPPTIVNIGGTLYITGMELVPPNAIPRYEPALFAELTAQYEARPKDFRLPKSDIDVREFPMVSSRDPNQKYTVCVYGNGDISCDCKGFQFRHSCKHTKQIQEQLKKG